MMKKTAAALAVLAVVAVAAVASAQLWQQEHQIRGSCTFLDDVARFDPVLGTFQVMNYRVAGTLETIYFANTGAPGTGVYCPDFSGEPVGKSTLTFRVEPLVFAFTADSVPLHALEALELEPLLLIDE